MEIKFVKEYLKNLYEGVTKPYKEYKSNPQLVKQYVKTINKLKAITKIEQLYQLKSLHYEKKEGNLKGVSAVYVNEQYRILFTEVASTSDDPTIDILEIEELSKHYEN
jgi:toxin HigB-1